MEEEILINVTPQEARVAVIQQGVVQELHVERMTGRGLVGNIYLGVVSRVLPGMQSAFIHIGLDRAAFLHVADIWEHRQPGQEPKPIERLLHEGGKLLVQVIKDPIGTKGARLSTQVSVAGRLLVYLPQECHIGISQRIEDEAERAQLRERLQQLLPAGETGGFIIRTMAETATDRDLTSDIEYLRRIWAAIQEKAKTASAPALLYQDLNLSHRVLRDIGNDETARILVDSRENYLKLQAFATEYTLNFADRIQHYSGDRPLFDLYGIEEEIERALARRVALKSGGYLIIDQTEALHHDRRQHRRLRRRTQFRRHHLQDQSRSRARHRAPAAPAQPRRHHHRRLHRHGEPGAPRRRADRAQESPGLDRTRVTVNSFTSLGLVEMTRKRTRESLAHTLCEPCPTCQGRGEVKTAQTVCYEILREIVREARQYDAREFRILAHQKVIDLFLDEESQSLAMLGDFIGKPISLQVESLYTQEQYDIVLM